MAKTNDDNSVKAENIENSLTELIGFLDSLPEPRLVINADYTIVGANKSYQASFGSSKTLLGRKCHEVSHRYLTPCDQHGEACPLKAAKESKVASREFHVHFTPGGQKHVSVELTPILDNDGQPYLFVETLKAQEYSSLLVNNERMVGNSQIFLKMLGLIERVAPSEVTVLLLGESGTGKEEVSNLIHKKSNRADQSFVIVECSGLTDSLFESEMFGHEKGSFTGALQNKNGLVKAAEGGTLFLDEIGDIPLNQQVKLLRLIETKTYRKVGGTDTHKCDFRLICATHKNLEKMVEEGTFRADLFYRISSFQITLPTLHERKEDMLILSQSLLKRIAPNRDLQLSSNALNFLENMELKGNIRELRNILERAALLTDGQLIDVDQLAVQAKKVDQQNLNRQHDCGFCNEIQTLNCVSSRYLQCIIRKHGEDMNQLSNSLGVSKRTLYRMIEKIRKPKVVSSN